METFVQVAEALIKILNEKFEKEKIKFQASRPQIHKIEISEILNNYIRYSLVVDLWIDSNCITAPGFNYEDRDATFNYEDPNFIEKVVKEVMVFVDDRIARNNLGTSKR